MIDGGFPVYLLDDGSVLFAREGLGHTEFWEREVALAVSRTLSVPLDGIINLPYCQRRGRVVGDVFYCGEDISRADLRLIERAVGMRLRLVHDEHESRCELSVGEFNALRSPCPRGRSGRRRR